MFGCGWYNVKWFNKAGEMVDNKDMYLTAPIYYKEVAKMQTDFMLGKDVYQLVATPIKK